MPRQASTHPPKLETFLTALGFKHVKIKDKYEVFFKVLPF